MSLELEWDKLDETLADGLVEIINKLLIDVCLPSFIGPVEVTGVDFGTVPPDIELIDMRDVYRDFVDDDEENIADSSSHAPAKGSESVDTGPCDVRNMGADEDDGFEWMASRGLQRIAGQEIHENFHRLQYGLGLTGAALTSVPGMRSVRDAWRGANLSMSLPDFAELRSKINPLQSLPIRGITRGLDAMHTSLHTQTPAEAHQHDATVDSPPASYGNSRAQTPETSREEDYPDIQLHFRVLWHSDMRISFTTSLVINYPSNNFMALPIKLSITGFVFDGEVVVAYESQRRRVHFCIIDDLDPYAPAADQQKRTSAETTSTEYEDGIYTRGGKPLPVGQRLFPVIDIESEIGQTDKHVLKNVTRVERFIQDFVRKTVEDELVFPNFHTILLGD